MADENPKLSMIDKTVPKLAQRIRQLRVAFSIDDPAYIYLYVENDICTASFEDGTKLQISMYKFVQIQLTCQL